MDAGPSGLPGFLRSFSSYCSDMGTELGVPDFMHDDGPMSLLPDFLESDNAWVADVGAEVAAVAEDGPAPGEQHSPT